MSMTPLPIHAAVHFGEVVQSPSGDVFGSTVNVAARLLGTAGPDEIIASRAAIEQAQGEAQARFVGGKKLKNVEAKVTATCWSPPQSRTGVYRLRGGGDGLRHQAVFDPELIARVRACLARTQLA